MHHWRIVHLRTLEAVHLQNVANTNIFLGPNVRGMERREGKKSCERTQNHDKTFLGIQNTKPPIISQKRKALISEEVGGRPMTARHVEAIAQAK